MSHLIHGEFRFFLISRPKWKRQHHQQLCPLICLNNSLNNHRNTKVLLTLRKTFWDCFMSLYNRWHHHHHLPWDVYMEELTPEFTLDRALTKETSIFSELLKEGVYKFLKSFLVKKEAIKTLYLPWLTCYISGQGSSCSASEGEREPGTQYYCKYFMKEDNLRIFENNN